MLRSEHKTGGLLSRTLSVLNEAYKKNCRHNGRQFFYTIYRPVSGLRMPINPEEYLVRQHPENTSILLHFWILAFAMCPNCAFIN